MVPDQADSPFKIQVSPYLHVRDAVSAIKFHQQALISLRSTRSGDFLGIPATGVRVEITGFEIVQIYGGRIHAAWVNQDNASLMAQLQAAAAKEA